MVGSVLKFTQVFFYVISFSILGLAQEWIGISNGVGYMTINNNVLNCQTGEGYEFNLVKEDGFDGLKKCWYVDEDTGSRRLEANIFIYDKGDSIKLMSLNGSKLGVFYKGNKFNRLRDFDFYSITYEEYDPFKCIRKYEVDKNGNFRYSIEDNKTILHKRIDAETIDSFLLLTRHLDIESIDNINSGGFAYISSHGIDHSITITSLLDKRKYNYTSSSEFHLNPIPYHFKPIVKLLERLVE